MTPDQLLELNSDLRLKTPLEIVRWAIDRADGRAIVSTNFRPYEAVLLHLCTQVQPDIPVLWVDHGYNRAATYRHAEQLKQFLKLNLQAYTPRVTTAGYEALYGPVPTPEDETALKQFSALMKLEPFQRGMRELAPTVWITLFRSCQGGREARVRPARYLGSECACRVSGERLNRGLHGYKVTSLHGYIVTRRSSSSCNNATMLLCNA